MKLFTLTKTLEFAKHSLPSFIFCSFSTGHGRFPNDIGNQFKDVTQIKAMVAAILKEIENWGFRIEPIDCT